MTWVGFAGCQSGAMSRAQFTKRMDVTPDGSGLGAVRDGLSDWLRRQGVREPELHHILIAAGEACSNVVEHSGAQQSSADPPAWIEATADEATVRIVVADRGRWKKPEPAAARRALRGRGRLLMTKLMDHVYIGTGPMGTTVQLVKTRAGVDGRSLIRQA